MSMRTDAGNGRVNAYTPSHMDGADAACAAAFNRDEQGMRAGIIPAHAIG